MIDPWEPPHDHEDDELDGRCRVCHEHECACHPPAGIDYSKPADVLIAELRDNLKRELGDLYREGAADQWLALARRIVDE